MRTRAVVVVALAGLLSLGGPLPALAAPPALDVRVDVGKPPRPLRLIVAASERGVELRVGKERVALPLASVAGARAEAVVLAGGASVAVVRVEGDANHVAALVTRDTAGRVAIPWVGRLDLRGDPGERSADGLELTDRTGDGIADVVVGHFEERVRLCGQDRTLLDARAVDPETLTLRPVTLDRLGPAPEAPATVEVALASPGPTPPAMLPSLRPAGASSRAQAAADLPALPPIEIVDGDLRTYWTEARGGGGRGEFVTLVRDGTLLPIRSLALVLRPLDHGAGVRIARPESLWLVGDGGARVRVRVPEAAYAEAGRRLWVTPPAPLAWRCLSIAFDTHHPVASGEAVGHAVVAEVEAYTELDFGGGADALVVAMNGEGARADDAALLATELGAPMLAALETGWTRLGSAGRRRALRVLAALAGREGAARSLLAKALDDPDAPTRAAALRALVDAGREGLAALTPRIATRDATGDAAALALAKHASESALDPLLAALAADGGSERPSLREALALVAKARPEATVARVRAWSAETVPVAARAAAALALAHTADTAEVSAELVERASPDAQAFEDRWRLARAAAALSSRAATDAWLATLARDEERWMLRAQAVTALHARAASQARGSALAALDDPYPRVRVAALDALAADPANVERIAKHARRDVWTMVRAAALDALARSPDAPGVEGVLREAVGDPRRRVRAAAVRSLAQARVRSAWPLVAARLADEKEWPEVTRAAVAFARALCVHEAADALLEALERGLRPDAWEPDVRLALESLEALLALGGEPARRAQTLATSEIAPEAFRATARRAASETPACEAPSPAP